MIRDRLTELYFITPIANVRSILELGILSHTRAERFLHQSIAMHEIQDRRASVAVPGTGKKLHDFANLYICARNPMLYKRRYQEVCVLAVSKDILDLPGAIVTDSNAASYYVSFRPAIAGLSHVDHELTFADDWTDSDQIQYWRKKAAKCAEVLIPDLVEPQYVLHAYVASAELKQHMDALDTPLTVSVDKHLFFR